MKMVEHKVIMRGRAVRGRGAIPSAAGAVLIRLENSLHGAVDVAFRRSSTAGRRQPWLRQAGQVEFRDIERTGKEEMVLYFEAPAFGDVAQDYYSQTMLFDDRPPAEDTAFDVLADAVADVLAGKADSDKYDVGLLKRFQRYQSTVFEKEVDELLISGHRLPQSKPSRISQEFPERARDLYLQTPKPARVRIAGKLDMIQASTLAFALLLPGGEQVRGVWKGDDFETLRMLANSDVAATGMAIYRPSGGLLRIDADALTPQRPADRFFARMPKPTGGKLDLKALVREQQRRGGLAAIGGKIAAEESDEEFLAAVAEMD
ncbi:MAG: hypothetical protein ACHRHE_14635 [Tepidisphaerales bacterium]